MISVSREEGQYGGGEPGLAIKLSQDGEELNEIFVYDHDAAPFLAQLVRALTPEQKAVLAQIMEAEGVA